MTVMYREPEFLPWDGRRVPMTFVGGYLGAGKTTVINEVLGAAERPIAVIVNDVGEINIDARLVRSRSGDTVELTDGCVCCSAIDGFGAAFDQIRARPEPPDHLIVELSGVAEPANVLPWSNTAGFLLDGVVVVVGADQLVDASMPDWVRTHLDRQIAAADLLVLSKTDLVDAERGRNEPGALGRFLALGGHRAGAITALAGPTLFDLHHTDTVPVDGPLDHAGIERLLDELPRHVGGRIVRAKGVIATPDGRLVLVQVVGTRREITPLLPTEADTPTDLVVISLDRVHAG